MDEKHVPPIGLRFWAVLFVACAFGARLGSLVDVHSTATLLGQLVLLAAVLTAVFVAERYDKTQNDVWYWAAVVVLEAAGVEIANFSTFHLGLDRFPLIVGLAILIAAIFAAGRSDEMHHVSAYLIARPQPAARALADPTHWTAMLGAGVLGTVVGDCLSISLGLGPALATLALLVFLAGLYGFYRRTAMDRMLLFWLANIGVRAASDMTGSLLSSRRGLGLGLHLCTLIAGLLTIGLVLLWRKNRLRA